MPNDCYTRQNLKEAKMCAFKTIGKIQYPSCPQCGKIGSYTSGITLSPLIELINHIYNGHEILNFRPGPVLQYCDKCGTVYFNPANTEVALSGTRNRIAVLSGFWFMLFAIITGYINAKQGIFFIDNSQRQDDVYLIDNYCCSYCGYMLKRPSLYEKSIGPALIKCPQCHINLYDN